MIKLVLLPPIKVIGAEYSSLFHNSNDFNKTKFHYGMCVAVGITPIKDYFSATLITLNTCQYLFPNLFQELIGYNSKK